MSTSLNVSIFLYFYEFNIDMIGELILSLYLKKIDETKLNIHYLFTNLVFLYIYNSSRNVHQHQHFIGIFLS